MKLLNCVHVVVFFALLSTSCSSFKPLPPASLPSGKPAEAALSNIKMQLSINKLAIDTSAKQSISRSYSHKGWGQKKLKYGPDIKTWHYNWDYKVKRGDVTVSAVDNKIIVSTALDGAAKLRWDTVDPDSTKAKLSLTVGAKSSLALSPNWTLNVNTVPFLDIHSATIPIQTQWHGYNAKTRISTRSMLNEKIRPDISDAAKNISQKIAHLNLWANAQTGWNQLAKPLQINSNPDIWLQFKPTTISYNGFQMDQESVNFQLNVGSYVQTTVGQNPGDSTIGPLPQLHSQVPASGLNIKLPVKISFETLRQNLLKHLVGSVYVIAANAAVTIKDIEVRGNGPHLVLKLQFVANHPDSWFDTEGVMYLNGVPVYDSEKQAITLEKLVFDDDTKQALLEQARWLAESNFLEGIRAGIQLSVTEPIVSAQQNLNSKIANVALNDRVILTGVIDSHAVAGIYFSVSDLFLDSIFTGNATVVVDDINYQIVAVEPTM